MSADRSTAEPKHRRRGNPFIELGFLFLISAVILIFLYVVNDRVFNALLIIDLEILISSFLFFIIGFAYKKERDLSRKGRMILAGLFATLLYGFALLAVVWSGGNLVARSSLLLLLTLPSMLGLLWIFIQRGRPAPLKFGYALIGALWLIFHLGEPILSPIFTGVLLQVLGLLLVVSCLRQDQTA